MSIVRGNISLGLIRIPGFTGQRTILQSGKIATSSKNCRPEPVEGPPISAFPHSHATRNCQHIANANKFPHIRRINALLGYETPQLVAPLELLSPEE
jgi:hypothetical protein